MPDLAKCPCGAVPKALTIFDAGQGSKWAAACGDCCGEWIIEFRTQYHPLNSEQCRALANDAWNEAPRGSHA